MKLKTKVLTLKHFAKINAIFIQTILSHLDLIELKAKHLTELDNLPFSN